MRLALRTLSATVTATATALAVPMLVGAAALARADTIAPQPEVASCASLAGRAADEPSAALRAICASPGTRVTHDRLARAARLIAERATPQDVATFADGEAAFRAGLAACLGADVRARDTCLAAAQVKRLSAAEKITAQLPSFSCAKPKGETETAICADPELASADREIAERYADLPRLMSREDKTALRVDQRAWLVQRDACATEADSNGLHACLLTSERKRLAVLDGIAGEQSLAFDAAVAEVADDPKAAAGAMRRFAAAGRPLADAWLAYLAHYAPASGVGAEEAARSLDRGIEAAVELDPRNAQWEASIRRPDEESKEGDPKGVLLLLRLLLDGRSGADSYAGVDKPYCFIFERHLAAYAAFGILYGSSLDSASAQCAAASGLFDQSAWYRLRAGFHRPLDAAEGEAGTIRYGIYTGWAAEALKATDMPQAFLGDDDTLAASRRRIRDWHGHAAWSKTDRDMVLAAIDPAITGTAAWLVGYRHLSPDQADKAAARIVGGWVAGRLGFIDDQEP